MEQQATRKELQQNFSLANQSLAEVETALQTTPDYIQKVLNLEVQHIEDPWILRNYLNKQIAAQHLIAVPYSRLVGASTNYWFLNQRRIARQHL